MSGFRMQSFAADVGPQPLSQFIRGRFNFTVPGEFDELAGRQFGLRCSDWFHTLPIPKQRDILPVCVSVEALKPPLAQDCLKQAIEDPAVWHKIWKDHSSALQRALFCYINQHRAFEQAVGRLAQSRYRFNGKFHDIYRAPTGRHPKQLTRDRAFRAAISPVVGAAFRPGTDYRIEQGVVFPSYPRDAGEVFQLVIVAGAETTVSKFHKKGTDPTTVLIEQLAVISYWPRQGRVIVSGKYYKKNGRKALVTAFLQHALGIKDEPEKIVPEKFLLSALASRSDLTPLRKTGLADVRFLSASYTRPNAEAQTHQHLHIAANLREALAQQGDPITGSALFPLTKWHALDLCLRTQPTREYPDGRSFKAKITPSGVAVESKLDDDLALLMGLLTAWGVPVDEDHAPLLRIVA